MLLGRLLMVMCTRQLTENNNTKNWISIASAWTGIIIMSSPGLHDSFWSDGIWMCRAYVRIAFKYRAAWKSSTKHWLGISYYGGIRARLENFYELPPFFLPSDFLAFVYVPICFPTLMWGNVPRHLISVFTLAHPPRYRNIVCRGPLWLFESAHKPIHCQSECFCRLCAPNSVGVIYGVLLFCLTHMLVPPTRKSIEKFSIQTRPYWMRETNAKVVFEKMCCLHNSNDFCSYL